ncbi:MAG: cytochrome P460 family protein [Acidobacteriota bacterium]
MSSDVYHNVYINPSAHRRFMRTGQFPDGTFLVLELMNAQKKNEPGLQGSYQGEQIGLEASVKDSRRFETAWTYYSFDEAGGGLKKSAQAFPKESCWSCHHAQAQTDHVFTQFYPTLRKKSD